MEALVTGNIAHVDDSFCHTALPGDHVHVVGTGEGHASKAGESRRAAHIDFLRQLDDTNEFDRIVYLSEYLTPHNDRFGDIEHLRDVLRICSARHAQFVLVSGPQGFRSSDGREVSGKGIIARSIEELCRYYAEAEGLELKIVRAPFLYSVAADVEDPFLTRIFEMCRSGRLDLTDSPDAPIPFLCSDELATLLSRIFDSWTPDFEVLDIPDCFHHTVGEFASALQEVVPGLEVTFGEGAPCGPVPASDAVRRRYAWFQRYDLLRDLSTLYGTWANRREPVPGAFRRLLEAAYGRTGIVRVGETLFAWVASEALVRLFSSSAQLNLVDYRLVFIVLVGTMYGLDFGVLAAALASAGLAVSYLTTMGYTFQGLFYEPSNWLPFIAYFVVGSVCGYIQLRNSEALELERDENRLLRKRNEFVGRLYHDALDDKNEFKRQLVGRRDSFGKIFAVTRELDLLNPRDIYRKCCQILQEFMENDSIAIYHVSDGGFARLVAASPTALRETAKSLDLGTVGRVLDAVEGTGLWVNRGLEAGLPIFAYGVRRAGALAVLIFVNRAADDQFTLYYQNLFRIICGLVESSLVRAFEYGDAVRDSRYVAGTSVLRERPFLEDVESERVLHEDRMSDFLLLSVIPGQEPLAELVGGIGNAIRESDAAGLVGGDTLYLLMRQASAEDYPVIERRLARHGISCEIVDPEAVFALTAPCRESASEPADVDAEAATSFKDGTPDSGVGVGEAGDACGGDRS